MTTAGFFLTGEPRTLVPIRNFTKGRLLHAVGVA